MLEKELILTLHQGIDVKDLEKDCETLGFERINSTTLRKHNVELYIPHIALSNASSGTAVVVSFTDEPSAWDTILLTFRERGTMENVGKLYADKVIRTIRHNVDSMGGVSRVLKMFSDSDSPKHKLEVLDLDFKYVSDISISRKYEGIKGTIARFFASDPQVDVTVQLNSQAEAAILFTRNTHA